MKRTLIMAALMLSACTMLYGGVAEDLKTLTGKHTRAVWIEGQGSGNDVFGKKNQHILKGLDTDDGKGIRTILSTVKNYNKPLITPKGDRVVYSDWVANKVYVVNFNGGTPQFVVNGFCSDVWLDPSTNQEWIYVATSRTSSNYANIYRYKLDSPSTSQLIWNKTRVGISYGTWFQVSVDGTKGAGSFPWSDCGAATLPNSSWLKTGGGCWTAMSPATDNYMWIFDGLHRNVNFYRSTGGNVAKADIHTAPGIRGWEVYHPKWSNHRSFFTMTGPYTGGSTSSCASNNCGNKISAGGTQLEAYVGKFSSTLTSVVGWVKLTANTKADYYPDVWIDPGTATPDINLSPTSLNFAAMPGGSNPSAKTVTVTAVGGQSLTGLTASETAGWLSVGISGSGGTRTLTNTVTVGSLGNGTYNTTVTVKAGDITKTYSVKLTIANINIKMNAGSNTVSGWASDGPYLTSGTDYTTTKTMTVSGVANAGPMQLYQSCQRAEPVFTFDVPNGTYTVRLHFCEPHFTTLTESAANRKMTIRIEGAAVLSNFDPGTAAGAVAKAYVYEKSVSVSDGNGLRVEALNGTGNDAFIMGIEVIAAGTTGMTVPGFIPSLVQVPGDRVLRDIHGRTVSLKEASTGIYFVTDPKAGSTVYHKILISR